MDEIRIIHTGDTHIGYRQYHSDVRRKDFLNAFSAVVDDAIDMGVDALIHSGDLFDSRNPTLDDILDAMELFSRLKNAEIPLLAIVGNHESKQNTQWLDLYGSLGLVTRLSNEPYRLGDVAIYGIDSVAKTKIPLFDYSIFDGKETGASYNLLVMHQLVKPFSFGDWDIKEVIESIPFDIHAVLLGDNHKYEITKVNDTWVTYAGSTERNSTSEREPRSYNIVTVKESGIDISKRIIPTRDFLFIPANVSEGPKAIEDVFNAIMEHDIHDKVVFVELTGDVKARLDFSEIEKFLLSRGALVPGIKDLRSGVDTLNDPTLKVVFSDPDDVVKEEIKKMNLTSGGLLLDDMIRDSRIAKTRMGDEAEQKLGELLEKMDFTRPVPVSISVEGSSPDYSPEPEVESIDETPVNYSENTVESEVETPVVEKAETVESVETDEKELPVEEAAIDSGKKVESADSTSKKVKKKKEDEPKPRQYNLGDYL
ncbi:metallophosphoesterase family protein [Methanolobus bombayensis]|uniref:metallophosphoesterase family protein n=1 Tax=Methanolobus bombayensis TaxID=38023 RepID=UPI001AE110B6|nr:exonuclease SbcCD subunit D [Methanolobus bombayensis]MBP1910087.1 DNA repair exonuclease SbcCD nuclease subunit [Methanolobus bombayensis]